MPSTLNNNKATGTDLMAAEILKELDDGPIENNNRVV